MSVDAIAKSCPELSGNFDKWMDCHFSSVANFIEPIVFYAPKFDIGDTTIALPLIIVWMALGSLIFTFYLGFINLRYFKHAIKIVSGKYDDKKDDGEISSFQALTASLSGTVGLGNIAGVAIAISVGGPGAALWMVLMGLFGMCSKFAEVSLGVKYRQDPIDGDEVFGGPMYYIKPAFEKIKMAKLGTLFAIFFCLACIGGAIGGGNIFQANQAYQQVLNITSFEGTFLHGVFHDFLLTNGWAFGVFLAILTGIVTMGGVKIIGKVTSKLIPLMVAIYLGAGLIVIGMNLSAIPEAFSVIISQAFTPAAGLGAFMGALIQGVKRASFSNEAGLGSAAIIYSATKTKSHIQQGFASMLGPFIDTAVICTLTALVIILTGAHLDTEGLAGVELTSRAFGSELSLFPYILALSVFLFAYSTLITWSYYAEKCIAYLFGDKKMYLNIFRISFLVFVVIGCTLELGNVVKVSEALMFVMAIPNLIAMYLLAPDIKRDLKEYISQLRG